MTVEQKNDRMNGIEYDLSYKKYMINYKNIYFTNPYDKNIR